MLHLQVIKVIVGNGTKMRTKRVVRKYNDQAFATIDRIKLGSICAERKSISLANMSKMTIELCEIGGLQYNWGKCRSISKNLPPIWG